MSMSWEGSAQEVPVAFSRRMLALVLPIALQNLISALVNSADIVMLGRVSQNALSAVSLAGQITFALMLFYFGISTGVGVLAAQYWGKGDRAAIERVLGIGCFFSVVVSAAFFVAALLLPEALMRILTNDEALVALGAQYLRALSFSYLMMSLSQIYLCTIKSMEQVRLSAVISSTSLLLNIAGNAVAVFVLFPGDAERAVAGVAASTVLARVIELAWCLLHSRLRGRAKLRLRHLLHLDRPLLKDFIHYTLPVQGNYLVWGGALVATSAIMGHTSSDMVAANSVASVVRNLALVLCKGVAQGGAVLVGKELGAGRINEAKRDGGRVVRWALGFGALAGLLIVLTRPLTLAMGSLQADARTLLSGMLWVCAAYCVGNSLNSTVISGIFCAGGDARFGFLCDTIVMWGVIIPAGLVCAFVLHWPPLALYIVLSMDEYVKLPFMAAHYRKYGWLKNITRESAGMEESI